VLELFYGEGLFEAMGLNLERNNKKKTCSLGEDGDDCNKIHIFSFYSDCVRDK